MIRIYKYITLCIRTNLTTTAFDNNFLYILQPKSTRVRLIAAASKEDPLLLHPKATQLKPRFQCARAVAFCFAKGELAGPILEESSPWPLMEGSSPLPRCTLPWRGALRVLAAPFHGGISPRHHKEGAHRAIPWRDLAAPSHEGSSPRLAAPSHRGSLPCSFRISRRCSRWEGLRDGMGKHWTVGFLLRKKNSQRVSWGWVNPCSVPLPCLRFVSA
jgi:hypothetical protein